MLAGRDSATASTGSRSCCEREVHSEYGFVTDTSCT